MWNLFRCRVTSLVSPYVRDVGGGSRLLLFSSLFSGYRGFSSLDAVEGCRQSKLKEKKNPFTVSYLVNSCGFSLESAKSRAKYVQFNSSEKPDSVLKLLKEYGFTGQQITKVVYTYPQILTSSDDRLRTKLEFLGSIGFLGEQRVKLITSSPRMLASSLHNSLIPAYTSLKSLLSEEEIVQCLKRSPRLLMVDVEKHLASKVPILSSHGVPQAHIRTLIKFAPRMVSCPADRFSETVKKISGWGFEPTKLKFIYAVSVICQLQESTWEQKINVYKSLGWSEEDVLSTFKLSPLSMAYSVNKIRNAVEFYVNKMGLTPSFLAKTPIMMGPSLEKRIKPRCSVMAVLLSAGLMKEDGFSYPYILTIGDKQFMDRFVTKYCKDVPALLECFPGKIPS